MCDYLFARWIWLHEYDADYLNIFYQLSSTSYIRHFPWYYIFLIPSTVFFFSFCTCSSQKESKIGLFNEFKWHCHTCNVPKDWVRNCKTHKHKEHKLGKNRLNSALYHGLKNYRWREIRRIFKLKIAIHVSSSNLYG